MIKVDSQIIDPNIFINNYDLPPIGKKTIRILSASEHTYRYASESQLKFELDLRNSIVNAAIALHNSNFSFKVFRKSVCNTDYWLRTDNGGFLLLDNVKPSDAINDIYLNSSLYGTECATAMVIVYYKALVDVMPEGIFNRTFSEIYLMNWQHLDRDIGIVDFPYVNDYLPGDGRYFKNPDVNPLTPEWQGENVFDLSEGMYYGHGIGIGSAHKFISGLNANRIPGSTKSAYLLESAKRPNFKHLASVSEQL
ncbi:MAG TPA: protein-glutamine gamma-glutamyltransferase [Pseudobacteroides sp.]|uniref:protein-glutamine gamma-glutamyltransferase n=1 Tax=Pseudobacteroides sp. TaxID=1968840 RepID=UPI002F93A356